MIDLLRQSYGEITHKLVTKPNYESGNQILHLI